MFLTGKSKVNGVRLKSEMAAAAPMTVAKNISTVVKSDAAGQVTCVFVQQGGQVRRGDAIVAYSNAGKQYELIAPRSGAISGLFVKPGDSISPSGKVCEIS